MIMSDRPTEECVLVVEYIPTRGRPTLWTEHEISLVQQEFEDWLEIPGNIWIKDFLIQKKLPPNLFTELSQKSKSFALAYKKAIMIQESRLFHGMFDSKRLIGSMFALKANHGWAEGRNAYETGETESKSARALDHITEIAIEYTKSITATSDKPGASESPVQSLGGRST
jgi:hypothetical protein